MRKYLIGIVLAGCLIVAFQVSATRPSVIVNYELRDPSLWEKDYETFGIIAGPEHFFFFNDEGVDLNVVPIDDDLLGSLKKRGKDAFVEDLLIGKNRINKMFAVGESKLSNVRVFKSDGFEVVELQTQQNIEGKENFVLERYFLLSGSGLHLELRWEESSNAEAVELARAQFDAIKIVALAGKSE